jgi:hypothetical protein
MTRLKPKRRHPREANGNFLIDAACLLPRLSVCSRARLLQTNRRSHPAPQPNNAKDENYYGRSITKSYEQKGVPKTGREELGHAKATGRGR